MIGKDSFSGAKGPRNCPLAGCGPRTSGQSANDPHGESATHASAARLCGYRKTRENENGAEECATRAGAKSKEAPGVAATNIPGTRIAVAIARSSFFT